MVFWDVIWQTCANITMKMEAATSCKTLVSIHQITWCHIPEVSLLWELQCQKFVAKSKLHQNEHSYKIKTSWPDKVCLVREVVTHINKEQNVTFQFKMTNGRVVSMKAPSPELLVLFNASVISNNKWPTQMLLNLGQRKTFLTLEVGSQQYLNTWTPDFCSTTKQMTTPKVSSQYMYIHGKEWSTSPFVWTEWLDDWMGI